MSLTELRDNFSEAVSRAEDGFPTVGTKHGKRAVAIVPVDVLDKYILGQHADLREMIRARENEDTATLTSALDDVLDARIEEATA